MHPRLLQLRGRVPAASGRQLQRRLLPVLQPPERGARADGGTLLVHKEVGIASILTSPCPRRGRREPKASDGRGATLATRNRARIFSAASQKVVLLTGGGPVSRIAIK